MASVRKYVQRLDGEGFTINSGELTRIACCDCGLVHDMVLVSEDGKPIGVAAKRNNRATAQRRRQVNVREIMKVRVVADSVVVTIPKSILKDLDIAPGDQVSIRAISPTRLEVNKVCRLA